MKVTKSYGVEIVGAGRKTFAPTIDIFRQAVTYIIGVVNSNWDEIKALEGAKTKSHFVEHYIHTSGANTARCDFDQVFHKFPSYFRRAAVEQALGAVQSYKSLYKNWISGGCQGNAPALSLERDVMPVFYKGGMSKPGKDDFHAEIKIFDGHDWRWVAVRLKKTDVKYIRNNCAGLPESAPSLARRHNKFFLQFAFSASMPLSDAPPEERVICAVDLGVNTDAVCSVMRADGTVAARKFVNFAAEKDRLYHVLNRIKKKRRQSGPKNTGGLWAYARRFNKELADNIAGTIADTAARYKCDCIVLEHLDFRGRKATGKSKRQKLAMWRKNDIQHRLETKAHWLGIRISRVCAWGTSRLAFDGSGTVTRNKDNRQIAVFTTGKIYNADLNASYNIGARYFIRELLKPVSATKRSRLLAKVPRAARRSSCTLADLRNLRSAM